MDKGYMVMYDTHDSHILVYLNFIDCRTSWLNLFLGSPIARVERFLANPTVLGVIEYSTRFKYHWLSQPEVLRGEIIVSEFEFDHEVVDYVKDLLFYEELKK